MGERVLRALDLFCCGGGFSEGFRRAGFKVVLGIDIEPRYLDTFRANHPEAEAWSRDLLNVGADELPDVDVIIGSPPCQAFSYANVKRDSAEGMTLVNRMLMLIEEKKPRFWIGENVPPILDHLPRRLPMRRILNSADYGVPQTRRRCFYGAYPVPPSTHARNPSSTLTGGALRPWVTVRDAIGDLPEPVLIQGGANSAQEKRMRTLDEPSFTIRADGTKDRYHFITHSAQSNSNMVAGRNRSVDEQPSFTVDTSGELVLSEEPLAIGKNAARIANQELPDYEPERAGKRRMDTPFMRKNPPLELDKPSRAVKSHIAKAPKELLLPILDAPATTVQGDPRIWPRGHKANRFSKGIPRGLGYRRLTARERARLQSFPDSYRFIGSTTLCYRMIGEAVPPLMSFHLANEMRPAFGIEKLKPPNDFLDWVGVDIPGGKVKEAEGGG